MAHITIFRKNWTPEGYVILSRVTEEGRPTFALAVDLPFPRPIMSDLPLAQIKRYAVELGRLERAASQHGVYLSAAHAWQVARATVENYRTDPLSGRTRDSYAAELLERAADRRMWRRLGVDFGAPLAEAALARLRAGDLYFLE